MEPVMTMVMANETPVDAFPSIVTPVVVVHCSIVLDHLSMTVQQTRG